MSDEIAEFLRRAAQRRAEQMQQQQRAAQQQQQYVPPPAPLRPAPVVEAEIIDDNEPPLRPALSRVSQHVAQHLNTSEFLERAERLGDVTEQTDERMDEHVHQAFDHRLGNISAGTHALTAADAPQADNEMKARVAENHPLLSMLRQPQSIRNAIIISELLRRPEQNW